MILQGRRREDMPDRFGGLPPKLQVGDFWRAKVQRGKEEIWEWWLAAPNKQKPGHYVIGRLSSAFDVQEHDDGAITVMPQPGNSNSILISNPQQGEKFHGWIKKGYWSESLDELNREVPD